MHDAHMHSWVKYTCTQFMQPFIVHLLTFSSYQVFSILQVVCYSMSHQTLSLLREERESSYTCAVEVEGGISVGGKTRK